jgi:hypothetical protein
MQPTNTKKNTHASIGIRTHDSSNQATKTCALERAVTGTGMLLLKTIGKINKHDLQELSKNIVS